MVKGGIDGAGQGEVKVLRICPRFLRGIKTHGSK